MRLDEVKVFCPVRLPEWEKDFFVIRFPFGWYYRSGNIVSNWHDTLVKEFSDRDDFVECEKSGVDSVKKKRGKTCIECRYFQIDNSTGYNGECRRYPPSKEGFAIVFNTSFCGEFKRRIS